MFTKLKMTLLMVFGQIADTSLIRTFAVLAIIVPLVVMMYGYLDDVFTQAETAISTIDSQTINYDGKTFQLGNYFLAYCNVAQIDTCLTTVFGYAASALLWSFTTDLKPAFVSRKK